MTRSLLRRTLLTLFAVLCLASAGVAQIDTDDPAYADIARRCMRVSAMDGTPLMAFWFSREYWDLMIAISETEEVPMVKEYIEALSEYEMFVVMRLPGGNVRRSSRNSELTASDVTLQDGNGKRVAPLDEDEVRSDVMMIADMMSTMLKQYGKQMNAEICLVLFRAGSVNDGQGLDPERYGPFTLRVRGAELTWGGEDEDENVQWYDGDDDDDGEAGGNEVAINSDLSSRARNGNDGNRNHGDRETPSASGGRRHDVDSRIREI